MNKLVKSAGYQYSKLPQGVDLREFDGYNRVAMPEVGKVEIRVKFVKAK